MPLTGKSKNMVVMGDFNTKLVLKEQMKTTNGLAHVPQE